MKASASESDKARHSNPLYVLAQFFSRLSALPREARGGSRLCASVADVLYWRCMNRLENSKLLHARASRVIPGGVNSPVRAFKSVGGEPPYLVRGKGSRIWDADGNEYID